MMEFVLTLSLVGLPLFSFMQPDMTRRIPLVLITGVVLLVVLSTLKIQVIWDYPTIAMICFGLWVIFSLSWTDSHQSEFESYTLLSLLILGYLARFADYSVILGVILAVGTTFALMSSYYRFRKSNERKQIHYIFGNRTHSSTFCIIPLFISLWAAFEVHPMFIVYALILAWEIYKQNTLGTNLGIIAGLFVTGVIYIQWYMLLCVLAFPLFFAPYRQKTDSILVRLGYWKAAVNMIKRKYLFGFGLNMFRKEYPNIIEGRVKIEGAEQIETGHRPHNDLLDIALELGIPGVIIFCLIFVFIPWGSTSPLLIGGFIAYMIAGMFFFPLREVHTAIPFWCFVGVLMGMGTITIIGINPFVAVVLGLLIIRIIYSTSIKALGLYFFHCSQKYPEGKQDNIKKAIGCDPYNSTYLMHGVILHVEKDPEVSFEYAMRQVSHFDGGKVKWGSYDHLARVIMIMSGIRIAEMYCRKALNLNPDFVPSLEMMGQIRTIKEGK